MQRLLCSHPDVLVWGEQGGFLRPLFDMTDALEWWNEQHGEPAREAFESGAHQSWLANLFPGRGAVLEAGRGYLLTLFQKPAAAYGRSRWGFKEVRFDLPFAERLLEMFPGARVIHVTRDPRDVLVSVDSWQRAGWWTAEQVRESLAIWTHVNESFLGAERPWLLALRYEDLVADPAGAVTALAAHLDLPAESLDAGVFERRIHSLQGARPAELRGFDELPADLRGLVEEDRLRRVAAGFGYELPAPARGGLRRLRR